MLRPYGLAGTHSRWDALIGVALIPALSQGERGLDPRWRRPLHTPQMKCERGNAPLLANLGGPVFGFPLAWE